MSRDDGDRVGGDSDPPARIPVPSFGQLRARALAASSGHPSAQTPPPQARLALGAMPQSARMARTFAAAVLADQEQAVQERVVLLVSELVTNAIRHTHRPSRLELRLSDSRVRVDVVDDDTRPPVLQRPQPEAEAGRGVFLLDCLADRWGWEPSHSGKRVWFELDVPTNQEAVSA